MCLSGEATCGTTGTIHRCVQGKGVGCPPLPCGGGAGGRERRQIPARVASLISPPHLPDRNRNLAINNQSATALQFKYKVTGEDCRPVLAVSKAGRKDMNGGDGLGSSNAHCS